MNKIYKAKSIKTIDIFYANADFQELRKGHTNKRFGIKFQSAFTSYIEGDWKESLRILNEKVLVQKKNDAPSLVLKKYMESFGGVAPPTW